jgi:hypothetical protein
MSWPGFRPATNKCSPTDWLSLGLEQNSLILYPCQQSISKTEIPHLPGTSCTAGPAPEGQLSFSRLLFVTLVIET